ncbi:hypothetical protein [Caulobacter endophyticus]|uniref:hypothetical protein n=1 Tax=Caulobacter endophyticus TaxID=2172652 RepID=UPI00240FF91B|nr:hypothetical protein [Caulobacter endophyticus]MDG2529476.1 hypothetical protein [Caulobacter endophyticus]
MQKQVAYDVHDSIEAARQPPATPEVVRLAGACATPVDSPARQLQREVAAAFGAKRGWSVRRTVVLGAAYHGVVLSALLMAAIETFSHITS